MKTKWWKKKGDRIRCELCPRNCELPEGSRGFCFVRQNIDGKMELTTYGKSTGFCIDPIEKKPLNHFYPGTSVLSFGTAGCNLGCKFCQNWDISKSREIEILSNNASPEEIVSAALRENCKSIAFTYNDPVIWAEYAIDTAKLAREVGIKTVAVTAGYITPKARKEFYSHIDAANIDLKAFTEEFYEKTTLARLQPVLDTLVWLKKETNVWIEITNLMIPGKNDSIDEIDRMCDWIVNKLGVDVPLHFTAFHPDYKMLDIPKTPHETLLRAREQALKAGIKYAYVGNVDDAKAQSTYCSNCDKLLIERNWYELGEYHVTKGKCAYCQTKLAGRYDSIQGNWGRRRLPVQVGTKSEITDDAVKKKNSKQKSKKNSEPTKQVESRPIERVETIPVATELAAEENVTSANNPKIDFLDDEKTEIISFVRSLVESSVTNTEVTHALSPELHSAPAYGVFITLKRGQTLRACRGRWGEENVKTLGEILKGATIDTALYDPRFPSICNEELSKLTLDISVMHSASAVLTSGEDRINDVEVGKHGLVISHPNGRGLLLPQVAAEAEWDSKKFLEQVCVKANLPQDAWLEKEAELLTFQATVFESPPITPELNLGSINANAMAQLCALANLFLAKKNEDINIDQGLLQKFPVEFGVAVKSNTGITGLALGIDKSLVELTQEASNIFEKNFELQKRPVEAIHDLFILSGGIVLKAEDYPKRTRTLRQSPIVIQKDGNGAVVLPTQGMDTLASTLKAIAVQEKDWGQFTISAYEAIVFSWPPKQEVQIRQPAHAGTFYPADVQQMVGILRELIGAVPEQKINARAVMLPHAGWQYCGGIIGKTLGVINIPKRVIILSPKHTSLGPQLSVPPEELWRIPGADIKIASDLSQLFKQLCPGMEREDQAHLKEHGVEVLLPFFRVLNPEVEILPVVIGNIPSDYTKEIARALVRMFQALEEPPLLVISSDMNHFAPQEDNRRRDQMALQALGTGDAGTLFQTCVQNEISMCGLLPAMVVMQALQALGPLKGINLTGYADSSQANNDKSRVVGYAGVIFS